MSQQKPSNQKRTNQPMFGPRGAGSYLEKPQDFKGTMKKLAVYLKPYYAHIITAAILAIISSILTVVGPYLLGLMVNELSDAYKETRAVGLISIGFGIDLSLGELALTLVGVHSLAGFFGYLQSYMLIGMTQNLTYMMRKDLSSKINRLPLKYFDDQSFGDILGRVTNDVETINATLSQTISEVLRGIALLIGIIVAMYLISWILATIVLFTTILSLLVTRRFVKLSQGYFRKQARSSGQLNGHIEETYGGHAVVKVFNHQEKAYQEFDMINDELYESAVKSQFISGIMWPVQFFIGNISYILIAVVGALLVISTNPLIAIQVGVILTFIQYTRQINQPIQSIGNVASILQSTAAASERIFNLLQEPEESPERDELTTLNKIQGHVVFKDVYFGYNEQVDVIKGFNAEIKPGQTVAIVGPTGAGKTTIVNLLMRFYEIKSGSIEIDGVDIRQMKRADVRALFGMVLQDTWLFEGTVLENIQYGSDNKTLDEVYQAAKAAQTHHFIESLPDSYQFQLNEDGMNISQGQRQLITISRAMLANRPMLILDEATSSVDTRTEVLIQKAMEILMRNRTSFVIAHRLSTIRDADVIFVMRDGNIIEQGNHDHLIKEDGFYAKLYNSQFDSN